MPGKTKTDLAIEPADVRVGKRIRARRLELGITQIALGNHLNISFQQVQKYESGVNRVSSSRLLEIAIFFKVELDYFFRVNQIANEATLRDIDFMVATKDGMKLLRAIMKIENKATRTRIVRLIEAIAINGRYTAT